MSAQRPQPVILHADQEHSGLRLAVFVGLFIGLLLSFFVLLRLLGALASPTLRDYRFFLSCAGALPLAVLLIWGLERLLKRVWHSGLSLELDARGLTVRDTRPEDSRVEALFSAQEAGSFLSPDPRHPSATPDIVWAEALTQLNWCFRVAGYPRAGRERRVPSKWLCLGTELQQDGKRLNVFTFMPPAQAAAFTDDPRLGFHRLNPTDVYGHATRARLGPPGRPTIPNTVLHSKDGRYWLAERRRWEHGVELTADDFATLMDFTRAARRPGAAAASSEAIPTT